MGKKRAPMDFIQVIAAALSKEEIDEYRAMLKPELKAMIENCPPKVDRIKSSDNNSHIQWFRN
jgi:hypothetical protein